MRSSHSTRPRDAASGTPGKRRQPRRPLLPAIRLPGANPKWVTALATASRYARERMQVVVTGEPGVGKWTVVREMIDSQGTSDGAVTIDCRDLTGDDELDGELPTPSADVIVLRHLDVLGDVQRGPSAAGSTGPRTGLAVDPGDLRGRPPSRWARPNDCSSNASAVSFCGCRRCTNGPTTSRHRDGPRGQASRGRDVRLAPDAVSELSRTSWPGNIRQLEDVVRSVASCAWARSPLRTCRARSGRGPLAGRCRPSSSSSARPSSRRSQASDGNKVAAQMIGLSRSTIYRKIRAYGIDRESAFF